MSSVPKKRMAEAEISPLDSSKPSETINNNTQDNNPAQPNQTASPSAPNVAETTATTERQRSPVDTSEKQSPELDDDTAKPQTSMLTSIKSKSYTQPDIITTSTGQEKRAMLSTKQQVIGCPSSDDDGDGGSNRWNLAEFQSEEQKQKFLKLMGGGKTKNPMSNHSNTLQQNQQSTRPAPDIMKKEGQQKVLADLEQQYTSGLQRRMGNRTGGLGS